MTTTTNQTLANIDLQAAENALGIRPDTSVRLMQLALDEEASIEELRRVVESDPNLAAKTLKLSNSSFYGMRNRVSRIDRAIALLGVATIARIASSGSVETAFRKVQFGVEGLGPDTAWRYSISVAMATEVIVAHAAAARSVALRKLGGEAFVSGLIHDIGVVVQAQFNPEKFQQAVVGSIKSGIRLVDRERATTGTDHTAIGMALGQKWELPEPLCAAIGHHHDPLDAPLEHQPLACIVYIASQLVRRAGVPSYDGDTDAVHFDTAFETLRLDARTQDQLIMAIKERLAAANAA